MLIHVSRIENSRNSSLPHRMYQNFCGEIAAEEQPNLNERCKAAVAHLSRNRDAYYKELERTAFKTKIEYLQSKDALIVVKYINIISIYSI